MLRLTENVLIGGRVRFAGEGISGADAEGVRPEVFEASTEKKPEAEQKRTTRGKRTSDK